MYFDIAFKKIISVSLILYDHPHVLCKWLLHAFQGDAMSISQKAQPVCTLLRSYFIFLLNMISSSLNSIYYILLELISASLGSNVWNLISYRLILSCFWRLFYSCLPIVSLQCIHEYVFNRTQTQITVVSIIMNNITWVLGRQLARDPK